MEAGLILLLPIHVDRPNIQASSPVLKRIHWIFDSFNRRLPGKRNFATGAGRRALWVIFSSLRYGVSGLDSVLVGKHASLALTSQILGL